MSDSEEPEGLTEVFRLGLLTLGDTLTDAWGALEAHPEKSRTDDGKEILMRSYRHRSWQLKTIAQSLGRRNSAESLLRPEL